MGGDIRRGLGGGPFLPCLWWLVVGIRLGLCALSAIRGVVLP